MLLFHRKIHTSVDIERPCCINAHVPAALIPLKARAKRLSKRNSGLASAVFGNKARLLFMPTHEVAVAMDGECFRGIVLFQSDFED